MDEERDILGTIPAEWHERAAAAGCLEAGFGAGPACVAGKIHKFDPPASLEEAAAWVQGWAGVLKKAHIQLGDGHVLWFHRSGFWRAEWRETAPRQGVVVRHAAEPDGGA
jgi:hypothetical protein